MLGGDISKFSLFALQLPICKRSRALNTVALRNMKDACHLQRVQLHCHPCSLLGAPSEHHPVASALASPMHSGGLSAPGRSRGKCAPELGDHSLGTQKFYSGAMHHPQKRIGRPCTPPGRPRQRPHLPGGVARSSSHTSQEAPRADPGGSCDPSRDPTLSRVGPAGPSGGGHGQRFQKGVVVRPRSGRGRGGAAAERGRARRPPGKRG